jgi:hypothetical protein
MEWLDARWPSSASATPILGRRCTAANRKLVHRYIDVWEYPDGRIEVRPDGTALPCVPYDRLAVIGHGEVIDHNLTAIGSTQP